MNPSIKPYSIPKSYCIHLHSLKHNIALKKIGLPKKKLIFLTVLVSGGNLLLVAGRGYPYTDPLSYCYDSGRVQPLSWLASFQARRSFSAPAASRCKSSSFGRSAAVSEPIWSQISSAGNSAKVATSTKVPWKFPWKLYTFLRKPICIDSIHNNWGG